MPGFQINEFAQAPIAAVESGLQAAVRYADDFAGGCSLFLCGGKKLSWRTQNCAQPQESESAKRQGRWQAWSGTRREKGAADSFFSVRHWSISKHCLLESAFAASA
jgi:hypothetical protein